MTQFLGHNPDLLNCLDGEPIRQSALGRNIPVIEVLMRNQDLEINLRGEKLIYSGLNCIIGLEIIQPHSLTLQHHIFVIFS